MQENFYLSLDSYQYWKAEKLRGKKPIMTVDEIKHAMDKAGFQIESDERLTNETGTQLRLKNGSIVNCFDNGNYTFKEKTKRQSLLHWEVQPLRASLQFVQL